MGPLVVIVLSPINTNDVFYLFLSCSVSHWCNRLPTCTVYRYLLHMQPRTEKVAAFSYVPDKVLCVIQYLFQPSDKKKYANRLVMYSLSQELFLLYIDAFSRVMKPVKSSGECKCVIHAAAFRCQFRCNISASFCQITLNVEEKAIIRNQNNLKNTCIPKC